jgi:hypothetical protein
MVKLTTIKQSCFKRYPKRALSGSAVLMRLLLCLLNLFDRLLLEDASLEILFGPALPSDTDFRDMCSKQAQIVLGISTCSPE